MTEAGTPELFNNLTKAEASRPHLTNSICGPTVLAAQHREAHSLQVGHIPPLIFGIVVSLSGRSRPAGDLMAKKGK
jgi:hypothetical protein